MSLILRIGRWSLTLFEVGIDDGDGPPFDVSSGTEIAPGFAPSPGYWEDEDHGR